MRLDKRLSLSGERSRSQARKLILNGRVTVDGAPVRDISAHIEDAQTVLLDGSPVIATGKRYMVINKPAGVLTAARDSRQETVMSLLPAELRLRGVMPVGRLDRDTTGALLLTDDGELAHRLLSPKRHVDKLYRAVVDGALTEDDIEAFARGLDLSDFIALPAQLTILSSADSRAEALITVREGKYHQIKRMFLARGRTVISLHREAFGGISAEGLGAGEYRLLSNDEVRALHIAAQLPFDEE